MTAFELLQTARSLQLQDKEFNGTNLTLEQSLDIVIKSKKIKNQDQSIKVVEEAIALVRGIIHNNYKSAAQA